MNQIARVIASQTVSVLGDQVVPVSLAVALTMPGGGGAGALGLVLGARTLGLGISLLAGGFLGATRDMAAIIRACDFGRAIVLVLLIVSGSVSNRWAAAGALLILGLLEGLARPSYQGIIPRLVPRSQLMRVNSWSSVGLRGSLVAGPAVGALVVTHSSVSAALWIDVFSFLMSAILLLRVRGGPATSTSTALTTSERAHRFAAHVVKPGWPRPFILVNIAHVLFAVAPWQVLLPVIALKASGPGLFSVLLASYGIGSVAGGFLGRFVRSRRPAQAALVLMSMFVFMFGVLPILGSLPIILLIGIYVLGGIALEISTVLFQTFVHVMAGDQTSEVFSLISFGSLIVNPVGMVLGGVAASTFGLPAVVVIGSVVMIGSSVFGLTRRSVRRADIEFVDATREVIAT